MISVIMGLALAAGPFAELIILYAGYLTQVKCSGRLLVSAIGNDRLVILEPLPKDLGCGVVLKPTGIAGRTNLLLETSTGPISLMVDVRAGGIPKPEQLTIEVTSRFAGGRE